MSESEKLIYCACGCGELIRAVSGFRPRRFVMGHQHKKESSLKSQVLAILRRSAHTAGEIADELGVDVKNVKPILSRLKAAGQVSNDGEGTWVYLP